ncbi:transglycosylase SLT domain-containing protein [Belliella kenyensis]|uniref:Transglycosylase SLT domain-containing protein n=1 Tax=Belliella kenyensis TaxID=1472724 RepID=A0ABV8EPR3_9BACT|nr:transporter substrate-binding domain-containing protein [Belliella kenyensis]MCH7402623.1 transporter substrate-binding domain-containing protein [Belliella kenyensis]MDN3603421.1 transporter substrate-binding domain-containing protein [Belliella kenyensis]
MKRIFQIAILFFMLLLFGVQCTFFQKEEEVSFWEEPVLFDLDEIKKRGYIRAVVDNSSTSYYIYRGRRMGYEFELLRNLASNLGVRLHLIVKSDIEEAFILLNRGQADIIAMNLEQTPIRINYANFTLPLGEMSTVLIQRKSKASIGDFQELDQKSIYIPQGSIYKDQLCFLNQDSTFVLNVVEVAESREELITKVVKGEIDYTVADKDLALVNATYYNELDVSVEVSEKSPVSWAVRTNAPQLESAINDWIFKRTRSGYLATLYAKYFLNSKNSYYRNNSAFSSLAGNKISAYDDIIKKAADKLGWDWRLLASLVYKESGFDAEATSYAGASGLLQLMPVTLDRFGVEDPNDPYQSLMGGVNFLGYLDKFWRERIPESNERIKFILASYNIGHGHVEDAWRLTLKYGKNPQHWEHVSHFLKLKTDPEYYRDPIVKSGYAKGHVAVTYVEDILILYNSYRVLVEP